MNKRERLEATIHGQAVDRVPVALWRHFPGDDQRPADLAAATLAFQQRWDFDFVKVTPASSYCVRDWGAEDIWLGNIEGTRDYTLRPVRAPEDWLALRVLDPQAGALGDQLRCLSLIRAELPDTPIIQTIFNPLAQAKNLAGPDLIETLRTHPHAARHGLETIAQTTVEFIRAARATGIDGIFYAVQHASAQLMSVSEYREFGAEYDRRVLDEVGDLWLNVLHLHGDAVYFDLLSDYPVQVWNWHDRETPPDLKQGLAQVRGAVCGGIARDLTMLRGAPASVTAEIEDAIQQTNGRRLIVGTGCVTLIPSPEANLRAARSAVQSSHRA
ncbi:MAG TPA: uroporphyrinogen decarboxylase family protein [Anaerolineae bacterium]|nr:uroporphyrinogen decarboxylase family protein [Anaerolineae bacterium]